MGLLVSLIRSVLLTLAPRCVHAEDVQNPLMYFTPQQIQRACGRLYVTGLPPVASLGPLARSLGAARRHWLPSVASLGLRPGHWALRAVIVPKDRDLRFAQTLEGRATKRAPGSHAFVKLQRLLSGHVSPVGTDSRPTRNAARCRSGVCPDWVRVARSIQR